MASKSGGKIPQKSQVADCNQAIAILDQMHHWSCTVKNHGDIRGHSVTITHAGKRVTAHRRTFIDAAIAGLAKLRGKEKVFMRIAEYAVVMEPGA